MKARCVALLGRRDKPTDAVDEYCRFLGAALKEQGISFEVEHLPWCEVGWRKALEGLERQALYWRKDWVLLQYTALAWSRRGFPLRFLRVVRLLRRYEVRSAVVFHDAEPYGGNRLVDRVRREVQRRIMREAVRLVDLAVLTIPKEKVRWLPADTQNAVFIPVGANLPSPETVWAKEKTGVERPPTVVVFSLSRGRIGAEEVKRIAEGLRYVAKQLGQVRLVMLGRNSESAGKLFREISQGTDLIVRGLLAGEEVVKVLGESDVMLFARGEISTRRGSAIAGIACGLPIVGLEGWETGGPIREAGVELTKPGEEFGPALMRVLGDPTYRASLAERSRKAQQDHFSWQAIAQNYSAALRRFEGA